MSISRLRHTTIYVLDQDEAKAFYLEKLGFNLTNDSVMDGFRWLTVAPPEQPDLEMALMPLTPNPMMDADTTEQLRALVAQGAIGGGVLECDDCQGTYETLKARGVEFMSPPTEQPYGIEALMKDNSGNWFSLVQVPG